MIRASFLRSDKAIDEREYHRHRERKNNQTNNNLNHLRLLLAAPFLLWSTLASAQGVIPLALAQQQDVNGRPLVGAQLYIYQVGTVATRQDSFLDFGLTIVNPWPLQADTTGRIPMFYLANGQVHVRLTDAFGVVQFDNPNLQVVGPSAGGGGGGGGGSTIDPTTISAMGDIKFRMTSEPLTGWVMLNGQTIGSSMSGANTASDSLLSLYTYLWTNCNQTNCPVAGGMRGISATVDFSSGAPGGKPLTLPDWRGRGPIGLDNMGGVAAAGRIAASNVTSAGGSPTTLFSTGGAANHTMVLAELIQHNHALTDPGHTHTITPMRGNPQVSQAASNIPVYSPAAPVSSTTTDSAMTGLAIAPAGSASPTPFGTMSPFFLGSWYIRM